jgi:Fe-S-cluster containining protein
MKELERLKEHILREYPRLTKESTFSFKCHKGVPCFNECCRDVNIFLTPYDIVRLRRNLKISSTEFLRKYTASPFDKNLKYPILQLLMGDDEKKKCPFVEAAGCSVYPNRPWACRIYPLGLASPGDEPRQPAEPFFFLLREDICKGFLENRTWTVAEWLKDQGIDEYDRMGEYFKDVTTHKFFREGGQLTPQKIEMFFLASYDIDRFRDFLFESSFFDRFDYDAAAQNRLKTDDLELLRFGADWLKFALFGEKTMSIKSDAIESQKKKMSEKKSVR